VIRYLRVSALFFVVQGCILALLIVVGRPSNTYLAAITDKSERLASAPSPRLVLVGDSNLAFGVDSRRLQRRLAGRYHPVNMGLHGGLGLDFELNQALAGARPGDIIVLSPSYESVWANTAESATLWSAILSQPTAWRFVPDTERPWLLERLLADNVPVIEMHDVAWMACNRVRAATLDKMTDAARRALGQTVTSRTNAYTRQGFNEYGDQTGAWGAASKYDLQAEEPFPAGRPSGHLVQTVTTLREFVAECANKDVRVVYAYPAVPEDWYLANRDKVEEISKALESSLEMPFLNQPADVVYEPGLFFDTRYHLRRAGVEQRTNDLLRGLMPYLTSLGVSDGT